MELDRLFVTIAAAGLGETISGLGGLKTSANGVADAFRNVSRTNPFKQLAADALEAHASGVRAALSTQVDRGAQAAFAKVGMAQSPVDDKTLAAKLTALNAMKSSLREMAAMESAGIRARETKEAAAHGLVGRAFRHSFGEMAAMESEGQERRTAPFRAITNIADLKRAVNATSEPLKAMDALAGNALQNFASGIGVTKKKFTELASDAGGDLTKLGQKLQELHQVHLDKAGKAWTSLGTSIKVGLGAGVAALTGFVKSGIEFSGIGEVLSFQWKYLSLGVASIFLPAINAVSRGLREATNWVYRLNLAQQDNILHWVASGAAALGVAVILPRVITLAKAAALAFGSIGALGTGGITALASVFAGALVSTKEGRAAVVELGKAFGPLLSALQPVVGEVGKLAALIAQALVPIVKALTAIVGTVGPKAAVAFGIALYAARPFFAYIKGEFFSTASAAEAASMRIAAAGNKAKGVWAGIIGGIGTLLVANAVYEGVGAISEAATAKGDWRDNWLKAAKRLDTTGVLWAADKIGVLPTFGKNEAKAAEPVAPRRGLALPGGGFESITASYARLAEVTGRIQGGKTPEERTAEATEKLANELPRTTTAVQNIKPAAV